LDDLKEFVKQQEAARLQKKQPNIGQSEASQQQ
jgi:hypothetical protein